MVSPLLGVDICVVRQSHDRVAGSIRQVPPPISRRIRDGDNPLEMLRGNLMKPEKEPADVKAVAALWRCNFASQIALACISLRYLM
jgi:hypothetical protein